MTPIQSVILFLSVAFANSSATTRFTSTESSPTQNIEKGDDDTPFQCYNGPAHDLELLQKEQCLGTHWCMKVIENQQRLCDPDNYCPSIGHTCGKTHLDIPGVDFVETICCCDTELCNDSMCSNIQLSALLSSLIFAFFGLH